ncbi:PREDICTED: probable peptide chain release factor C12orf65, mitochondrial [Priapulus caudatus]|uniref:Probable peptide chain release factor C12orf65, mitochondrial n=1 Tax=Priapulus caudatus TaxID=37621 RepID=A0ABM1E4Z8_PRICU|nr:PREDICTED: probable peptide chain release factor C12orf65, mitochondrial [Priapulus caudatus]
MYRACKRIVCRLSALDFARCERPSKHRLATAPLACDLHALYPCRRLHAAPLLERTTEGMLGSLLRRHFRTASRGVPPPPSSLERTREGLLGSVPATSVSVAMLTTDADARVPPVLVEEELEEDFVKGSGPGGQSVNKTSNCVVLKHKPTNLVVKCHQTRSLQQNRKLARELLLEKLDVHLNGEASLAMQRKLQQSESRKKKKNRSRATLQRKKDFKAREGLE